MTIFRQNPPKNRHYFSENQKIDNPQYLAILHEMKIKINKFTYLAADERSHLEIALVIEAEVNRSIFNSILEY